MGFFSAQVATSGTAAAVLTTGNGFTNLTGNVTDPVPFVIKNIDSTITIYLGGSGVTTSNGYPLLAGQSVTLSSINSEAGSLWAVAASGTPKLSVLAGRQ